MELYKACKECLINSTCNKDPIDKSACEPLLKEKLEEFFRYNFLPPITNPVVIKLSIKIINEFRKDNYDFEIDTTEGKVSAIEVANDLQLHYFVEY